MKTGEVVTADTLLPFLTYIIVRSKPSAIVSNIEFVFTFMDGNLVNGELGCTFTNFSVAYSHLMELEPGSSLITTYATDDTLPPQLAKRISMTEYKGIIGPICELTEDSDLKVRGRGAFKGAAIGASVMAPLAAVVGIATLGLGVPISLIILGAGAGVGTGFGAALPMELRKKLENIESYVNHANDCLLRQRGVILLSPIASNATSLFNLTQVSVEKMRSLTWAINSAPVEKGEEERNNNGNDD